MTRNKASLPTEIKNTDMFGKEDRSIWTGTIIDRIQTRYHE